MVHQRRYGTTTRPAAVLDWCTAQRPTRRKRLNTVDRRMKEPTASLLLDSSLMVMILYEYRHYYYYYYYYYVVVTMMMMTEWCVRFKVLRPRGSVEALANLTFKGTNANELNHAVRLVLTSVNRSKENWYYDNSFLLLESQKRCRIGYYPGSSWRVSGSDRYHCTGCDAVTLVVLYPIPYTVLPSPRDLNECQLTLWQRTLRFGTI